MSAKPSISVVDRERALVATGVLLVLFALMIPFVALRVAEAVDASVAQQLQFLMALAAGLALVAAVVTVRRARRYRGLAAVVVGSTMVLVAAAGIVEGHVRDGQMRTFQAEFAHRMLVHERHLARLDDRILSIALTGSLRFHDLADPLHREHLRRRLADLDALHAARTAYRERIRADLVSLVRGRLPVRSWRATALRDVEAGLARFDAAHAARDVSTIGLVTASRRTLDWFDAGRPPSSHSAVEPVSPRDGALVDLVSRTLAAESAFDDAHRRTDLVPVEPEVRVAAHVH